MTRKVKPVYGSDIRYGENVLRIEIDPFTEQIIMAGTLEQMLSVASRELDVREYVRILNQAVQQYNARIAAKKTA